MQPFLILATDGLPHGGPLLAASPEGMLIFLVIAAVSAIYNWWKKKNNSDTNQPAPPPMPRQRGTNPPPPPAPTQNWEEELRRLLDGDAVAPPPPPPPPIIQPAARRVPPPPKIAPRLVEVESPEPPMFQPMPTLHQSAEAYERASRLDEMVAEEVRQASSLATAAQAFLGGSQLDDRMAAAMRQVTLRPVGSTGVTSVQKSAETQAALEMIRNPRSIRTAMIASVILGPPVALAE